MTAPTGRAIHAGFCIGGPLDGQEASSRFPRGFLLVDKPAGVCWLYDWRDDGYFAARSDDAQPCHTDGPDNRYRAADEGDFDVIAAPWVGA